MKQKIFIFSILITLFSISNLFGQGTGTCQKTSDPGTFVPSDEECWKWVNTTTGDHFCYNGSAWVLCQGTSGTDDQNIQGSGLSGTILTIGIEDGASETVDLGSLQDGTGTDDQNISGSSYNSTTKEITIGIEDGASETVDLSDLDNDNYVDDFQGRTDGQIEFSRYYNGTLQNTGFLTNLDVLPAYDTKADADAALPAGRLWRASDTNTMGKVPGTLFITY